MESLEPNGKKEKKDNQFKVLLVIRLWHYALEKIIGGYINQCNLIDQQNKMKSLDRAHSYWVVLETGS